MERLRDDKDRRIVKIGLSDKGVAAATERDSFLEELLQGAVAQVEPDKLRYFISTIDNINQYFLAKSSMSYVKTAPFALEPLQLGKKDLPIPIVQAGMSLGIAGSNLASAVAAEGGLGLIGASDIGWQEALRQGADRRQRAVGKSRGAGVRQGRCKERCGGHRGKRTSDGSA